jgi:disulfide bond formation protein DsbB
MDTLINRILSYLRNPRLLLLAVALYCAVLLVFAFVIVRVVDGLVPCPLCIVQRFFYAFVGIAAITGYMGWWSRFTERASGLAVALLGFIGWLVSARHVYLQRFHEADPSSGCAVSFGSFLDDVLFALGGTGNCAIIDWSFIGLSIADWSFLAFTGLTAAGVWIYLKGKSIVSSPESTAL